MKAYENGWKTKDKLRKTKKTRKTNEKQKKNMKNFEQLLKTYEKLWKTEKLQCVRGLLHTEVYLTEA